MVIAPPGNGGGAAILLARATTQEQVAAIGRQTGGRVFLFLETDDLARDVPAMRSEGVRFEDLYGNLWDLVEPSEGADPR